MGFFGFHWISWDFVGCLVVFHEFFMGFGGIKWYLWEDKHMDPFAESIFAANTAFGNFQSNPIDHVQGYLGRFH